MLGPFLKDLARRPFAWGQTDCAIVLADWWRLNHGVDPCPWLRAAYASEEECAGVLAAHGHLPRLVARIAREAGARRTASPQPGDFAVVRFDGRWWGAIRTPTGRWFVKAGDGAAATNACRVVAAWSIACP